MEKLGLHRVKSRITPTTFKSALLNRLDK